MIVRLPRLITSPCLPLHFMLHFTIHPCNLSIGPSQPSLCRPQDISHLGLCSVHVLDLTSLVDNYGSIN